MKQEKIHILSLLAALVASVIFGMSFMFSKLALAVAQPSVLLAFRFTVAVAAMTLVIAVNALAGKLRGRKLFAFNLYHKPVGRLVLLGLVQPVAYFIFENYGILYTSSAVAGTIIAAVPVCCILMDVLVLHERVTVKQVLCALGAVGGVALISAGGAVMISALGLLFLLLAGWGLVMAAAAVACGAGAVCLLARLGLVRLSGIRKRTAHPGGSFYHNRKTYMIFSPAASLAAISFMASL